jgi:hypothetical protein
MTTPTKRQPNAATVSRTLREAGFTKSSPYAVWGYETEGFQVVQRHGTTVHVLCTLDRHKAAEKQAAIEGYGEALRAAGYNAETERNRAGEATAVRVYRWQG